MRITALITAIMMLPLTASAGDFPAKEVYSKYSPSVVVVRAVREGGAGSVGTGSIISKEGLVITNAHVIIDKETDNPYSKIGVFTKPPKGTSSEDMNKYYDVQVLKYDIPLDLAVLKIKGFDQRPEIVEFTNPDDISVGEEVVAIGHPESGGFWTLTYGRISTEVRNFQNVQGKDMYQTDTSVNRGNSGGPLLDRRGYMVAVNSNIARQSGDGLAITGINYSIKSSVVKKWLDENGYKVAYGTRPLEEKQVASVKSQEEKESKPEEKKVASAEQKKVEEKKSEKKFETPKKPYDYDDFLKKAEKELDDMMDEMREKIRR